MLNSRATKAAVVLVAGALIASTLVAASPAPLSATTGATGDLDTTFDTDGWNTISGTGLWFEAASVVVQSSGKVVVAGARMNGSQFDPLIARFNTDGSLDTTFGSDGTGIVVEPWPNATLMEWVNRSGAAVDVALLSDDRIVVTSSPSGDNEKHGIMLFTAEGVLDPSFWSDGRRKIASGGPNMDVWTTAVTVTSDDKIMIVGTSPDNSWDYRMKVYRLNTDGSLDTSFSNDGMRNVNFPGGVDHLANAVVMTGDKTIVGGSAAASWSRHDMGIAQLKANGQNDLGGFADGKGKLYVDFGFGDSDVRELLVQADGKIVAIGESQVFDNDDSVAVTRLNADGSLDTSFSGDGKFAHDFGNGDSYGWAGAIDEDGRIVIAGQYNNGASDKAFVMRLTTAGELDTSFGTGGIKTFDFVADHDEKFNAIAVQGDDMVVAGASGSDLLVARLGGLYSLGEVTFNANGGTGAPSTVECWSGSVTLPSTAPTRSGYTFAGWNTAANGSGTNYAAGASVSCADVTLYAQWTQNTSTIAYDANGGSGDPSDQTCTSGNVTLSSTAPTRSGYTFAGWNTAANGSGTNYAAGASVSCADVTLYAQWSADTLDVVYDSQGGSNVTDGDATTTTGGSIATLPTDPTRTGYTFNGWFTAASGGSEITAGAAHNQTGDFTLYAQWQINTVTLAYDTRGGTGQPDAHVGDAGSTVTVSSIVPTRAGYTFAGWNPQIDGSGSPCLAGDEYTLPMEGSASLFAQWQVTPTTTTTTIAPTTTTTTVAPTTTTTTIVVAPPVVAPPPSVVPTPPAASPPAAPTPGTPTFTG